uniref:Glycosyl hydrolase family 13 catalytic domain-containing protein n=1 Tax=Zooxanthella nutricula TaxID=1333877 RepID=A0A6V0KC07_9DINO|mmetsp:Transcript_6497/g.19278  ORF Transcript_6497/g.19278 Transcript_6497/m.19278 type:complete len:687 (+) Transcript_6497:142-2202(+)
MAMRRLLLSLWLLPGRGAPAGDAACAAGQPGCQARDDGASMLQLQPQKNKVLQPSTSPEDRFNVQGKSVYLVMTDRFNRVGGYSDGNMTECSGNNWCNGTFAGIQEKLPYIKGMGFDCIWVTPVVENPAVEDAPADGTSESGWAYHGYWAQNYYETDPHYGTKQQLKDLVEAVHDLGMCFILDIVMNHMGPIHPRPALDVYKKIPFNKPEYYHQVDRGDLTWNAYTAKYGGWPVPAQAMGPGTLCRLDYNSTTGEPDYTNGGNYCNNYKGSGFGPQVYDNSTYLGKDAAGPPNLKYCGAGNFDCPGYDQTLVWEGWFYDLGDLNQSHPYVRKMELDWIDFIKENYDIDAIRLDTTPYMTWEFLSELQQRADPVQIHGEVTTTNISFHASFLEYPAVGGEESYRVLAGLENFPTMYMATPGYCGDSGQPSSPIAEWDLTKLGDTMTKQIKGPYTSIMGLMNFVDNQDYSPVANTCKQSESRIKNSFAWVFMCYGMPTVTWGDEQGNTLYRNSLWQFNWDTTTWQYQFIKTLNAIREDTGVRFMDTEVVLATKTTLTFRRFQAGGEGCAPPAVWVFTNSLESTSPVVYDVAPPAPGGDGSCQQGAHVQCPSGEMCAGDQCCQAFGGEGTTPCPSASPSFAGCENNTKITNCLPAQCAWKDALTGAAAQIAGGKVTAPNSEPLILVCQP